MCAFDKDIFSLTKFELVDNSLRPLAYSCRQALRVYLVGGRENGWWEREKWKEGDTYHLGG